jgi:hypothetical protein
VANDELTRANVSSDVKQHMESFSMAILSLRRIRVIISLLFTAMLTAGWLSRSFLVTWRSGQAKLPYRIYRGPYVRLVSNKERQ